MESILPYPSAPRLAPSRHRERVSDDLDRTYQVLDEARVCHVGTVVDGWPHVVPTMHVRVDDTLYLHGSVAARLLAAGRQGAVPLCVTVTLLDGLVLARSAFNHSVNYRSAVVRGSATLVGDETTKRTVFGALVDRSAPNRSAECRPPTRKELAATAVLALPLTSPDTQVAVKVRQGGVIDEPEDLTLPYWAGVVPLRTVEDEPIPDPFLPGLGRTERQHGL